MKKRFKKKLDKTKRLEMENIKYKEQIAVELTKIYFNEVEVAPSLRTKEKVEEIYKYFLESQEKKVMQSPVQVLDIKSTLVDIGKIKPIK